jgi:hypothetical protein
VAKEEILDVSMYAIDAAFRFGNLLCQLPNDARR